MSNSGVFLERLARRNRHVPEGRIYELRRQ